MAFKNAATFSFPNKVEHATWPTSLVTRAFVTHPKSRHLISHYPPLFGTETAATFRYLCICGSHNGRSKEEGAAKYP